jgi:hypothetical protein
VIRAECHSADDAMSVEFDATPWFEEADADSVVLLARQDWTGPGVAEVLGTRPGYEGLGELLRYARERLGVETREDPSWPTFACRVDRSDATTWLARNRPELAGMLRPAR